MAVARISGRTTATATAAGVRLAAVPALAAALSASSAGAHLAVMAPHWREWWLHGAFFLACGVTQALLALLILWRPWSWVLLTGIAGNLAIVTMYVYSRTNGAPVGPHEGVPEAPGALDLTTTAGELVLVALLVAMLSEAQRRWAMRLVLLVGVALWTARATGIVV